MYKKNILTQIKIMEIKEMMSGSQPQNKKLKPWAIALILIVLLS